MSRAVHVLGPPGIGKIHLDTALGVEASKAGKSVYFTTRADLTGSLARSERKGRLHECIRFFCRPSLHRRRDRVGYRPLRGLTYISGTLRRPIFLHRAS
ncbi:ATP-binding protein [Ferranicluibacter rubi]|uniref:ATP-binding protein n=1 Tax=Ferranicluibacter rubi TaxID=2715133 RepID=UPI00248AE5C7|nr:ATP-binding protein [Ferranicluibacter rubi]